MSNIEQTNYKLITSKEDSEIRDYIPMTLAEVEVSGSRKQAISEGFKWILPFLGRNEVMIQIGISP